MRERIFFGVEILYVSRGVKDTRGTVKRIDYIKKNMLCEHKFAITTRGEGWHVLLSYTKSISAWHV